MNPSGMQGGAPVINPVSQAEIDQTTFKRGRAAAAGAGIGLFAGWLLGGPIGGAAVGTLIGGLRDRGIDDKFVKEIAAHMGSDSVGVGVTGETGRHRSGAERRSSPSKAPCCTPICRRRARQRCAPR